MEVVDKDDEDSGAMCMQVDSQSSTGTEWSQLEVQLEIEEESHPSLIEEKSDEDIIEPEVVENRLDTQENETPESSRTEASECEKKDEISEGEPIMNFPLNNELVTIKENKIKQQKILWHRRMGHVSAKYLNYLKNHSENFPKISFLMKILKIARSAH